MNFQLGLGQDLARGWGKIEKLDLKAQSLSPMNEFWFQDPFRYTF